jgi:sugar lactone lactonase YvrE
MVRKITSVGVVSTLAGNITPGAQNGTGTAASFKNPFGIAVDRTGNLFVADYSNHLIRKITATGVVSIFAGSGAIGSANGTGTAASFNYPSGIAVDSLGNVYVGDEANFLIRKITPDGVVTTLAGSGTAGSADGTGTAASFHRTAGISIDGFGNIFVSDYLNNMIRKVTPSGVVTTIAGTIYKGFKDGLGSAAAFFGPSGIAVDASGNVFVGDYANNAIRKIIAAGVSTLAGNPYSVPGLLNGTSTSALFSGPTGVALDGKGNVFVADASNNVIRKIVQTGYTVYPTLPAGLSIDPATGIISGTPMGTKPATTYYITGTNATGSSTISVIIAVDVNTNNINPELANISVYPNPTSDGIYVNVAESLGKLSLCDLSGRVLMTKQLNGNTYVNLSQFANGIYIAKISTANGSAEMKIVKK